MSTTIVYDYPSGVEPGAWVSSPASHKLIKQSDRCCPYTAISHRSRSRCRHPGHRRGNYLTGILPIIFIFLPVLWKWYFTSLSDIFWILLYIQRWWKYLTFSGNMNLYFIFIFDTYPTFSHLHHYFTIHKLSHNLKDKYDATKKKMSPQNGMSKYEMGGFSYPLLLFNITPLYSSWRNNSWRWHPAFECTLTEK